MGHIRDLPPARPPTCPSAVQKQPWARSSAIDIDNDFKPLYVVAPTKKDRIRDLKATLKDADRALSRH